MTKRPTCYLAGPMRGLPYWNKNAFLQAASELRSLGYEVHSPWEHDAELGMKAPKDGAADELQLAACLSWDFQRIIEDDVVFMLPGWEQSTGCHWELTVAFATSTPVRLFPTDTWQAGGRTTPIDFPEVVTNPTGCIPADGCVETAKIPHSWINTDHPDLMATKVAQAVRGQNAARDIASDQGEHRVVDKETGGEKGQKSARTDLLPVDALMALAEHYGRGSLKYADRNWERGYSWSLSHAALLRHAFLFWGGEDIDHDAEIGDFPHVVAMAWHAIALLTFYLRGAGTDDRPRVREPHIERDVVTGGMRVQRPDIWDDLVRNAHNPPDAYAVTGPAITICDPHANHGCPVCEGQR